MSRTVKNIVQTSLFIIIFGALLAIASVYDYQISTILAKPHLPAGQYYSSSIFGIIFEVIGSAPIYIAMSFSALIFSHHFQQFKDGKQWISVIFIAMSVAALYFVYMDVFKYSFRFAKNMANVKEFTNQWWVILIVVLLALGTTALNIFLLHKISFEKNRELFGFALVMACTVVLYLIINFTKGPIGRMRFRAISMIGYDATYYTPWYQISDAKELVAAAYPSINVPSDGFKSCPSGHTFSAGLTYALICLPDICPKFNNKKWRVIWYIIPILYTGLVGFARIEVGAHYMSDVLLGGTLSYVGVELFRYFFITRRNMKKAKLETSEITE